MGEELTPAEVVQLRVLLDNAKLTASAGSGDSSSITSGPPATPAIVHHWTSGLAMTSMFSDGNLTEWLERFDVCATANGCTLATKITQIPTFLEVRAFAIFK